MKNSHLMYKYFLYINEIRFQYVNLYYFKTLTLHEPPKPEYNMEESFNNQQQRVEAPLAPNSKKYPHYKKHQTQQFNTQRG